MGAIGGSRDVTKGWGWGGAALKAMYRDRASPRVMWGRGVAEVSAHGINQDIKA